MSGVAEPAMGYCFEWYIFSKHIVCLLQSGAAAIWQVVESNWGEQGGVIGRPIVVEFVLQLAVQWSVSDTWRHAPNKGDGGQNFSKNGCAQFIIVGIVQFEDVWGTCKRLLSSLRNSTLVLVDLDGALHTIHGDDVNISGLFKRIIRRRAAFHIFIEPGTDYEGYNYFVRLFYLSLRKQLSWMLFSSKTTGSIGRCVPICRPESALPASMQGDDKRLKQGLQQTICNYAADAMLDI